jgi:hypothetical protein
VDAPASGRLAPCYTAIKTRGMCSCEEMILSHASASRPTEQVAKFFARCPSPEEIAAFRLPDETLAYIRELLYKNSTGSLTAEES